uniref:Uncharacterized protein n=1 Tax=Physcomitrium patens TaxID=3218 RepID=A0A2K1JL00_PHYPA|nr:hypothetical protein PHYPA_017059 [Physcomitrium patens]
MEAALQFGVRDLTIMCNSEVVFYQSWYNRVLESGLHPMQAFMISFMCKNYRTNSKHVEYFTIPPKTQHPGSITSQESF